MVIVVKDVVFQGGFSNGQFEGQGNLMYLVGDYQAKYQGLWRGGKQHGNGTYYYIDGRIYKGGWEAGRQVQGDSSARADGAVCRRARAA